MTDRALLQQSLEALELAHPRFGVGTVMHANAITALRERLAQPECNHEDRITMLACVKCGAIVGTQPERKPLTEEEIETLWQNTSPYYDHQDFARAIEAKLKEKNA